MVDFVRKMAIKCIELSCNGAKIKPICTLCCHVVCNSDRVIDDMGSHNGPSSVEVAIS